MLSTQNILPEKPPENPILIFLRQLKNPLVYVLLIASIITLIIGDYSDAIIIFLAVLINTVLGYVQESRASHALLALKKFITSTAIVIREGNQVTIDASQIIVGDTVVLNQGAKIPADGQLLFSNRFFANEAILTGESLPVAKSARNPVYMGTTVSAGQATMKVTAIGTDTQVGAIALEIQKPESDTPLQKQLKTFSQQLTIIIGLITLVVFLLGLYYQYSLHEIFITSVALAVSSIPEGLLVSLTAVLAIGMQKILKYRGLVTKLSAAETLGGVTVICVDKTGTLTEGQMKVAEAIGIKPDLALQVILTNDMDDPMVISAHNWGKSIITSPTPNHHRFDHIPFSSKDKFLISLHRGDKNKNIIFVNGAPEIVLNQTNLSKSEKDKILLTIDKLTKQGKRIIGYGQKEVSISQKTLDLADATNLTWVGLLAFSDPVRVGVKEALSQTVSAGIKTIVITGDYATTTQFVLKELGIVVKPDEIMTGVELSHLSVAQLSQKLKTIKLFARTSPNQKNIIVEALQKSGEVVAMMGDGVNDAPALHQADIGVVVASASDVAKESADIILLDSNFSTVVRAIEEGRAMFDNIRKVILYLMTDAFAEIILIVGGIIFGLPLPVTAIQILWINLVSDGLPGLALTIDPKKSRIMSEPPRSPREKLVVPWMIQLIGLVSIIAGIISLSTFFIVYKLTGDLTTARSMAFITLGLDSLVYVFSIRTLMSQFSLVNLWQNKWLIVAVIIGFVLQVLPFATEGTRQFFGLSSLSLSYWLVALLLSVLMFIIIEFLKTFTKKISQSF